VDRALRFLGIEEYLERYLGHGEVLLIVQILVIFTLWMWVSVLLAFSNLLLIQRTARKRLYSTQQRQRFLTSALALERVGYRVRQGAGKILAMAALVVLVDMIAGTRYALSHLALVACLFFVALLPTYLLVTLYAKASRARSETPSRT
jgi:hypothetical protein